MARLCADVQRARRRDQLTRGRLRLATVSEIRAIQSWTSTTARLLLDGASLYEDTTLDATRASSETKAGFLPSEAVESLHRLQRPPTAKRSERGHYSGPLAVATPKNCRRSLALGRAARHHRCLPPVTRNMHLALVVLGLHIVIFKAAVEAEWSLWCRYTQDGQTITI
jgi:hypothetical protein